MSPLKPFLGFSKEGLTFLRQLKRNNRREWFKPRKPVYDQAILIPSLEFVESVRSALRKVSPHLVVIPKMGKSVSRIYRDIRFREDKSPYKTEASFLFWDGRRPKGESVAVYFAFGPTEVTYGCGLWHFTPAQRARFRELVTEDKTGKEFAKIVKAIEKRGRFAIGGKALKRYPLGADPDNRNVDFLLYNAIYTHATEKTPANFFRPQFVKEFVDTFLTQKAFFEFCSQVMISAREPKSDSDELF